MKTLIVFYSRTNTTKKAALELQKLIGVDCDLERIVDLKNRSGATGYLIAGRDAMLKKLTKIKLEKISGSTVSDAVEPLDNYDIIIIGTPVWAFTVPPAIRTYFKKNYPPLTPSQEGTFPKIAFFTTQGSPKKFKIFDEMARLIGQALIAEMHLTTKEVINNLEMEKLKEFISKTQAN